MEFLSLAEFEGCEEAFDSAVAMTPGIATFCSGIDWQLSAHDCLHPARDALIASESGCWCVFARGALFDMPDVLQPLEAAWCFSSPLIGSDWKKSTELLRKVLLMDPFTSPITVFGGIPADSAAAAYLRRELGRFGRVFAYPGTSCARTRLDGGFDAFLSRRSASFRAGIRSDCRRTVRKGFTFEYCGRECVGDEVFRRLLDVEKRSWKFFAHASVFQLEDHRRFYRSLITRSANRGRLRAVFAISDGRDVAYACGGIMGDTFRGMQMGYDDAFASLGVGNVTQTELMRRLADEKIANYDLGMMVDYKERWCDETLSLTNLLLVR